MLIVITKWPNYKAARVREGGEERERGGKYLAKLKGTLFRRFYGFIIHADSCLCTPWLWLGP